MYYFDNAATTDFVPKQVINSVREAMLHFSANPGRSGHKSAMSVTEEIYKIRKKTAAFFGAENPDDVIFTANCTQSINTVLNGTLDDGAEVLVSDIEHNAVMRPVFALSDMGKIKFRKFTTYGLSDDEIISHISCIISEKTRMIFCTHASNVFGRVLPIEKIGELCSEKGILFGVDAAQTAGILPIDMKAMNIDYLCIAPHKGLYAPMGTGILIAAESFIKPLIYGGTGYNSESFFQMPLKPEGVESGTLNVPGIFGISGGIDFVNEMNRKNILRHERRLCLKLYDFLIKNGKYRLYTPRPDTDSFVPVLSFNHTNYDSETFGRMLDEKNFALRSGLHCAPAAHEAYGTMDIGTVRFAPGVNTSEKETEDFCSALEKIF